jgi:hypothetical protein
MTTNPAGPVDALAFAGRIHRLPQIAPFIVGRAFARAVGRCTLSQKSAPLPNSRARISAVVALALVLASLGARAGSAWKGDLLFVCAGLMGANDAVRMRRSGLSAMAGAALISVYSMPDVLAFLAARAEARGMTLDDLVNALLKQDIARMEQAE